MDMFCNKCGAQVSDGARFCTKCGSPLDAAAEPAQSTEPIEPAEVTEPVEQAESFEPTEPNYIPTEGYIPPELGYEPAAPSTSPEIPEKKPNKGLIAGIVAAVAVVLCVILFFAWIRPTYLSGSAKYDRAINSAAAELADEDYDAAIESYTTALSYASDDEARITAYVGRGDAYMGAEQFEKAIDDYEAALDLDDGQKKVWGKLADAYLANDDNAGAIKALQDGVDATGASSLQSRLDELTSVSVAVDEPTEDEEVPSDEPTTATGVIEIGGLTFDLDETDIDLGNLDVTDLSPLAACTNLQYLNLEATDVTDLTPLAGLTSLKWLELDHTYVSDLSPLANLTNLYDLSLYDTPVSDITPLRGLINLEYLTLWDTNVSDLSALSGLTNLHYLDIEGTPVTDITPVLSLTNLSTLYLDEDNFGGDSVWNTIAAALPQFDYMVSDDEVGAIQFGFVNDDGFTTLNAYGDPMGLGYDVMYWMSVLGDFETEWTTFDTLDEALDALSAGEIEALIVNKPDAEYEDWYTIFTDPYLSLNGEDYGVACNTYQVAELLDEAIAAVWDSGIMEDIYDDWLYE
jgi:tetratricopeptide (TPR) repeat protein